jgi:hypothetical protein
MDRFRNLRKYGSWYQRSVSGKNIDIFKFPIIHIHGFREMERIAGSRSRKYIVSYRVPDQCHFDTDPDPDLDPGPALFVSDFQGANKKQVFPLKFFSFLLSVSTFTLVFKDKKSLRSH